MAFYSAQDAWMYQQQQQQQQAFWAYQQQPQQAQNMMINLDYFSDSSDSSDDERPSAAAAVPKQVATTKTVEEPPCAAPVEAEAVCQDNKTSVMSPSAAAFTPAVPATPGAEPAAEPQPLSTPGANSKMECSRFGSTGSSSIGSASSSRHTPPRATSAWKVRSEDGSGSDAGSSTVEPDAELEAPPSPPSLAPAGGAAGAAAAGAGGAAPIERAKSTEEPEAEVVAEAAAPQHRDTPPRKSWVAAVSPSSATSTPSGRTQWHQHGHGEWKRQPRSAAAPSPALKPSENSWAAAQRRRSGSGSGDEDEDKRVVRSMKSILNKLTVEKFPQLYVQLIEVGVHTPTQVELLIQEVFDKATTQHHFIDMYADLCALLAEHFADSEFNLKRMLLNECQASFERHLTPPEGIKDIDDFDERSAAEHRYKTKMLGNIRFVGALATRKMLATKVMLAICHELLTDPTPETLESVAALLTVVGPCFDRKESPVRPAMIGIFHEIEAITKQPKCDPRAKCLLRDVLDLRSSGWKDLRPKRIEGPMKLDEVAQKAAEQLPTPSAKSWMAAQQAAWGKEQALQRRQSAAAYYARPFDHAEFRKLLSELRGSFDEAGAAERLAKQPPPPESEQASALAFVLGEVAQESEAKVRKVGFSLATQLFFRGLTSTGSSWERPALIAGLREFADIAADLAVDVPALPEIVKKELVPILRPLKVGGLISDAAINGLMATVA